MQTHEAVRSGPAAVNWKVLVGVSAVSAVTMSLTAIWFLLIGFLVFIGAAIAAVLRPSHAPQLLSAGGSVGLGLLVGPTIYLGLAVLT